MPLGSKIGENNNNKIISKCGSRKDRYLTEKQAAYIYRKEESGSIISKNTIRQEIDQDVELGKIYDTNGDENLYRKLKVNNAGK